MAMNNCANTLANNGVGVSDNKEDYLENIEEKLSVQDIKISRINKKIEESTKDYKKPSVNEPSVNDNQEQETKFDESYFIRFR
ncbi:hypothetical protein RhiirC2_773810 [Rhizophagus irregularis]|uniref:Uncharacterized protein n=1 Tax=Rhizophagus irregularis TaxID=588596 RepID=A0A2N1NN42_9GLOM|nr:hypothetical protein RhiirC2_773810 [Rhizophagus irregularis]